MKRLLAGGLICCLLALLGGCAADPDAPIPTPIPEPTATIEPTIAPVITPAPTPVPYSLRVFGEPLSPVSEEGTKATTAPIQLWNGDTQPSTTRVPSGSDPYSYTSLENKRLQLRMIYPEGWISNPTTDVITMAEPVEEGAVGARFSVTSMKYPYSDRDITTRRLKDHLSDYMRSMLDIYNEHQIGPACYDRNFAQSSAIYVEYVAVQGNAFVNGIIMAGYGKNGRVYCMHFSCEQDAYSGYADLIDKLAGGVTPTTEK